MCRAVLPGPALLLALASLQLTVARSDLAQPPAAAPAPAADGGSNDAVPATEDAVLPSSAYVTVTVVGAAVLIIIAGLAAYQYRRRKRLERERRARLEREALEQLEQQRRLARLAKAALEPVAVFIPPIILNPDASVHLGGTAHCGQEHSPTYRGSGASVGCPCCDRGLHGRRMLVRPGHSAFARVSLQASACGSLQFDTDSLGSSYGDDDICGSDAGGSCDGQCGHSSDAGASSACPASSPRGTAMQQRAAEAVERLPAEQQREAAAGMAAAGSAGRAGEEGVAGGAGPLGEPDAALAAAAPLQPLAGALGRADSCPAALEGPAQEDQGPKELN
ncbi:hypothetical protein ABPG75_010414 [Micractinium tetrahymenae]